MALTPSTPFLLESPNRLRFTFTAGLKAGNTEGYNLATGAPIGGAGALAAGDIAMVRALLARAGVALTGETAAHVRSCLKAAFVRYGGRNGAVVVGPVCELGIGGAGTEPVLMMGVINNNDDGAATVHLEINHSVFQ
jgi:hypothetical protein